VGALIERRAAAALLQHAVHVRLFRPKALCDGQLRLVARRTLPLLVVVYARRMLPFVLPLSLVVSLPRPFCVRQGRPSLSHSLLASVLFRQGRVRRLVARQAWLRLKRQFNLCRCRRKPPFTPPDTPTFTPPDALAFTHACTPTFTPTPIYVDAVATHALQPITIPISFHISRRTSRHTSRHASRHTSRHTSPSVTPPDTPLPPCIHALAPSRGSTHTLQPPTLSDADDADARLVSEPSLMPCERAFVRPGLDR
jgi:hypothetical protein